MPDCRSRRETLRVRSALAAADLGLEKTYREDDAQCTRTAMVAG